MAHELNNLLLLSITTFTCSKKVTFVVPFLSVHSNTCAHSGYLPHKGFNVHMRVTGSETEALHEVIDTGWTTTEQ